MISPPTVPSYTKELEPKQRLPVPSHRHAAPSAPWPWIDIHDTLDREQLECKAPPVPPLCDHLTCNKCWKGYPQSRFPNWTPDQVFRSKIAHAVANYDRTVPCKVYHVDVNSGGFFTDAEVLEVTDDTVDEVWERIKHPKVLENNRVRALFLDKLSGPVLQMLGTIYNIEPFFWSSSLNWIPSRFQEDPHEGEGDHITITLQFLKAIDKPKVELGSDEDDRSTLTEQMIDTQSPLRLHSNKRHLVLDLLSVHLIRHVENSVIISFHPTLDHPTTEAKYLHDRIRFAGQSVYWQKIFQVSPDPTFVLLTFIWHALYAWDEAFQDLYTHICSLEARVIKTYDLTLTQELHIIRAHQLHYSMLIEDIAKTVEFVRTTKNPAMSSYAEDVQRQSAKLMERECQNLKDEIGRLEKERFMQDQRLKNVMNLVFSSVNIDDSKQMQQMTEAAVKDSAGNGTITCFTLWDPAESFVQMKQIAYLTMVFLPATFVSGVFGMNITLLVPGTHGTLAHYFEVTIVLMVFTTWIIVAFQSTMMYPEGTPLWKRFGWPIRLSLNLLQSRFGKIERQLPIKKGMKDESQW